MNIPVAHLCGGDRVVGNVDDQVRHAVTKLAHLHFTTNQESTDRIIRMGEQPFRVHNVGTPASTACYQFLISILTIFLGDLDLIC